jgi:hypothetical protein
MNDEVDYAEVADDGVTSDEETFDEELDYADDEFGDADAYYDAFSSLLREGIHENHLALLRAHYAAPDQTTTWEALARAVGYARGAAVNMQYGTLAKRVASNLGIHEAPNGFWLYVLVGWGPDRDPETGHTTFFLRWPVIEALQRLGVLPKDSGGLAVDPEADLRRLIPLENLSDVLDAVAASIELAHWANPEGWALGLEAGQLVLTVGHYEVLRIRPGAAPFKIVVDSGSVPAEAYAHSGEPAKGAVDRDGEPELVSFFASAPGSELRELPLQHVGRAHALLMPAHASFVAEAGRGPLEPSVRDLHDPRLVDFVARRIGRSMPQPSYVVG